jgi:CheY-like chemotaxis protein
VDKGHALVSPETISHGCSSPLETRIKTVSQVAERGMQTSRLPNNLLSSTSVGSILYVEDDEDTRELVTLMLARSNYQVVPAENCDDALLLARANHFDLYLIDNWIPGGSGVDLCKKLREFNPWTPILFYSGAAYEGDKQQAFAAGAQGYWSNPLTTMS